MASIGSRPQFGYVAEEFDFDTAPYGEPVARSLDGVTPRLSLVPARSKMQTWKYLGVKRGIDIVVSMLMILACALPAFIIAAVIVITSRGPIFYRETRIGRNGRPFRIWKFRSMKVKSAAAPAADSAAHFDVHLRWRTEKDVYDPRITAVGGFLRRWSLDELPQLINVLCGDMSLVGPRPVVAAELPFYKHLLGFYLAATPGLSGLWQVSGRSNVSFATRASLDTSYVRTWSLSKDFSILIRTIPAVLRRVGAR